MGSCSWTLWLLNRQAGKDTELKLPFSLRLRPGRRYSMTINGFWSVAHKRALRTGVEATFRTRNNMHEHVCTESVRVCVLFVPRFIKDSNSLALSALPVPLALIPNKWSVWQTMSMWNVVWVQKAGLTFANSSRICWANFYALQF